MSEITGTPPIGMGLTQTRRRPSAARYWLAATLILVGLIGSHLLVVATVLDTAWTIKDFPTADIPGAVMVNVPHAGDQLVYYRGHADATWRSLGLQVTGPDGQSVPVKGYSLDVDYDVDEAHGAKALATFPADSAGRYTVTTASGAETGAELAVGKNVARPLIERLVGAGIIGLVGIVGGATLAVVTAARRAKKS